MQASGFEVVHSEVVGFVASIELGRVGPETAYELGRKADRPDADAIVMPGGNWACDAVVERLERELGKPVLVEQRRQPLGGAAPARRGDSIPGYGRAAARPSRVTWRKPEAANLVRLRIIVPGRLGSFALRPTPE